MKLEASRAEGNVTPTSGTQTPKTKAPAGGEGGVPCRLHGCCWETFYIFAYCGLVRSGIIFGGPSDSRGRVCKKKGQKQFAVRNLFLRAFRTSKSILVSYLALLLIPAAEFVETREKAKKRSEIRFFARFGPRKALWHHIRRSFCRVCRNPPHLTARI